MFWLDVYVLVVAPLTATLLAFAHHNSDLWWTDVMKAHPLRLKVLGSNLCGPLGFEDNCT